MKTSRPYALFLRFETSAHSGNRWIVCHVRIVRDGSDPGLTSDTSQFHWIGQYDADKGLACVSVRAQASADEAKHSFYGWDPLDLETRSWVDERTLPAVAKAFKGLRQKLDKVDATLGRPQSLGEFLARLASVLKAPRFYAENAPGYDKQTFARYWSDDAGNLRSFIHSVEYAWRQSFAPRAAVSEESAEVSQ